MEKLAQELVASNAHSLVSKIYDQYLDLTVLEPSLFTLNIEDSFMAYNDPSFGESQIRYSSYEKDVANKLNIFEIMNCVTYPIKTSFPVCSTGLI